MQSNELNFAFNLSDHTDQLLSGERVAKRFQYAQFGIAILGYGNKYGGDHLEELINNCKWDANRENVATCAKHLFESTTALLLAALLSKDTVAKPIGAVIVQGAQQTMNIMGVSSVESLAGGQPCPNNNENIYDKIETKVDKVGIGMKVSCRAGCKIDLVNSEISAVLGQTANFINNKMTSAQFTIIDGNSEAIAGCGWEVLHVGRYPCPGPIDSGKCHTSLKYPKDELFSLSATK